MKEESVQVTLDFTGCKYIGELYLEMRTKMEWEEDYGENLSALWDVLWGMPYKGDDFIIKRPVMFTDIPYGHDLEFNEYVEKIISIFERAQQEGYLTIKVEYSDNDRSQNSDYLV